MSLLQTALKITEHIPNRFIAPIPEADSVEVFSLQDGVPYWFKIRRIKPGWREIEPITTSTARLGREAYPFEYLSYLDQLPRYYVIACFRCSPYTWLCIPYNAADASQRGWATGIPRQLHLVRHAISPLDVVDARRLGDMLVST